MPQIPLPAEIDLTDLTPRVGIGFDTSGVKDDLPLPQEVLIIGQRTPGSLKPVHQVHALLREGDGGAFWGPGSIMDAMCRAAFRANPQVRLKGLAVDDDGAAVKATQTVTFANNATGDGAAELALKGVTIRVRILKNDTPTTIAAGLVAAAAAVPHLPAAVTNVAGVVTAQARNGGTHGNQIAIRGMITAGIGTTMAVGGAGTLAGGTTAPALVAALAVAATSRYHWIAIGLDDATSGAALRDHVKAQGDANGGKGQMGVQAIVGTLSAATTLAAALNQERNQIVAMNGSESMHAEVAAAYVGEASKERNPARPLNTRVLAGILPPPTEKRWIGSEMRTLIESGVTPLVVQPGDLVGVLRAVSTRTKNALGQTDLTLLDIGPIRAFDRFRDDVAAMFKKKYPAALWAQDDPNSLLPADVATPAKVRLDILDVARDLERAGILQLVEASKDAFVVNYVPGRADFTAPAPVVSGLHSAFGTIVYALPAVN